MLRFFKRRQKARWVIVGGGLDGVHLANRLVSSGESSVRIVDPHEHLSAQWRRYTDGCGQEMLRSPTEHHLNGKDLTLEEFARRGKRLDEIHSSEGFSRPTLALFNDHCAAVILENGLYDLHEQGLVESVLPGRSARFETGTFVVETTTNTIEANNVVLAIGQSGGPNMPDVARSYWHEEKVRHVADRNFDREKVTRSEGPVYVIGGGMSGVQLATRMAKERDAAGSLYPVTLISRAPLVVNELDADARWADLEYATSRLHVPFEARARVVSRAKRRGTIARYVMDDMEDAQRACGLIHKVDELTRILKRGDGRLRLDFASGREELYRGHLVFATGFKPAGKNTLVQQISRTFGLPTCEGYPIAPSPLIWTNSGHGRIYVIGELASLTIGPLAGNIIGARNAGDMIMKGYQ